MQDHKTWRWQFIGDCLKDSYWMDSIHQTALDRNKKEARRDPLPFEGDRPGPASKRPPLAWTLLWGGTYSNTFFSTIPTSFRRWGYVMWDAARLERCGAKEVLATEWEALWHGEDPREDKGPLSTLPHMY